MGESQFGRLEKKPSNRLLCDLILGIVLFTNNIPLILIVLEVPVLFLCGQNTQSAISSGFSREPRQF